MKRTTMTEIIEAVNNGAAGTDYIFFNYLECNCCMDTAGGFHVVKDFGGHKRERDIDYNGLVFYAYGGDKLQVDENGRPLAQNIFALEGEDWDFISGEKWTEEEYNQRLFEERRKKYTSGAPQV